PVTHEEPDRGGDAERKSWILNLQKQPQEDPSARTEDRCVDHALAQPGNLGVHVIAPGLYLRQGGRVERTDSADRAGAHALNNPRMSTSPRFFSSATNICRVPKFILPATSELGNVCTALLYSTT